MRRSAIGIDIGTRVIRAVQIDLRTRQIAGAVSLPRRTPGGEIGVEELGRLRSVLLRRGMTGDRIVLASPLDATSMSVLDLPPRSSGAPIERLARVEMARLHRCEPQKLEAACWDVPLAGKGATQCTVMAASCPSEVILELAAAAAEVGLVVEAIDLDCLAFHRAVLAWGADGKGANPDLSGFLIDLGASSGRLSVISGGTVVMERQLGELAIGEHVDRIGSELGVEVPVAAAILADPQRVTNAWRHASEVRAEVIETLASEVANAVSESWSYVSGRARDITLKGVWLAGCGATITDLAARVEASTGQACVTIGFDTTEGVRMTPEATIAAGLACWEIDGQLMERPR